LSKKDINKGVKNFINFTVVFLIKNIAAKGLNVKRIKIKGNIFAQLEQPVVYDFCRYILPGMCFCTVKSCFETGLI